MKGMNALAKDGTRLNEAGTLVNKTANALDPVKHVQDIKTMCASIKSQFSSLTPESKIFLRHVTEIEKRAAIQAGKADVVKVLDEAIKLLGGSRTGNFKDLLTAAANIPNAKITKVGNDFKVGSVTFAKVGDMGRVSELVINKNLIKASPSSLPNDAELVEAFEDVCYYKGDLNNPSSATELDNDGDFLVFKGQDGSVVCLDGINCFAARTLIKTKKGYKHIEELRVGDVVLSFNETKQVAQYNKVSNVFSKPVKQLHRLITSVKDTLWVTADHSMYLANQTRIAASALLVGMALYSQATPVTVVENTLIDTTAQVYNFTVKETHNYFVGKGQVLVHNSCRKMKDMMNSLPDAATRRALNNDLKANPALMQKFVDGELDVKAWEGLMNAPNSLRKNTLILERGSELITLGFSKVDLELLSTALNKLANRSISPTDLEKITEYALNARKYTNRYATYNIETDLFKQIDELASSSKFKNPEDLKRFLSENQLLQNINENPGNLEQMNEAVKILKQGDDVYLESQGILKGDIVNFSKNESIQFKASTSPTESKITDNLNLAANQFATEPAAQGYKKVAAVKTLNSSNPYYTLSNGSVKIKLQAYVDIIISQGNTSILSKLNALDEIKIINSTGTHKFKLVNGLITNL
jgi:hypothetical protein